MHTCVILCGEIDSDIQCTLGCAYLISDVTRNKEFTYSWVLLINPSQLAFPRAKVTCKKPIIRNTQHVLQSHDALTFITLSS